MSTTSLLNLFFLAALVTTSTAASDEVNVTCTGEVSECHPTSDPRKPYQCTLYMAPSSIPNAGYGVFTILDIAKGEKVKQYADAPYIPLCDAGANGLGEEHGNHNDYLWAGMGWSNYECITASEIGMNLGSLSNYHTYLHNVHPCVEPYDDTIVDRFSNPNAGAITYHKGHIFDATQDIAAGDEIFAGKKNSLFVHCIMAGVLFIF